MEEQTRTTVLICTDDETLFRLCSLELYALRDSGAVRLSCTSVAPDMLPGIGRQAASSSSLLILDFDAFEKSKLSSDAMSIESLLSEDGFFPCPTVGISRHETDLPESLASLCRSVLHRPFSLRTFREVLLSLLTGSPLSMEVPPLRERRKLKAKKPSARKTDSPPFAEKLVLRGSLLLSGSASVSLTPGEAVLVSALLNAAGEGVSREVLSALLGQDGCNENLVNVHVCALRKKLAMIGKPDSLTTVRKKGYRLRV